MLGTQTPIVPSNKRSLDLDGLDPSLEGRFDVRLANGEEVRVQTVFSLLKERLATTPPRRPRPSAARRPV